MDDMIRTLPLSALAGWHSPCSGDVISTFQNGPWAGVFSRFTTVYLPLIPLSPYPLTLSPHQGYIKPHPIRDQK